MLSNLIVTNQKVVLIIDQLNRDRIALKFIGNQLQEQGEDNEIKTLPIGTELKHVAKFKALLKECYNAENNQSPSDTITKPGYNIILPTLADLLCYQSPAFIFDFLNRLRRCANVRRIFLWASPKYLQQADGDYILGGCEYMAELVLRLETESTLSLISRNPGGGVTNKRYNCQVTKTEFNVTPFEEAANANASPAAATQESPDNSAKPVDPGRTFKIELDEDEVIARNAITLPFESISEAVEGNIIYTPDANDDFDDEDPDEDLLI